MARTYRRRTRARPLPVGPVDPHGFDARIALYDEWMQAAHYAPATRQARQRHLGAFQLWSAERALSRPADITLPILEAYQRFLAEPAPASGAPLRLRSQTVYLISLREFFAWLARSRYLLFNPASELRLPRFGRFLPRAILSVAEVEKVLALPDLATPLGRRDRAILETFYSTAIRRAELAALQLADLDPERGWLAIRSGKGGKDRFVPLAERCLGWLLGYLALARPELALDPDEPTLFLSHTGQPLTPNHLSQMVRDYVLASGIGKPGSCHLFRHTAATLMLNAGADIRFLQVLLGHSSLDTTQIYTHVALEKLKAVHARTHPGAHRAAAGAPGPDERLPGPPEDSLEPSAAAEQLADLLAADADEEADAPLAAPLEPGAFEPPRKRLAPRRPPR